MPRKKKQAEELSQDDILNRLLEIERQTKEAPSYLKTDHIFTPEEVNLPEPIKLKQAPSRPAPKPRYCLGDHFYFYLPHKRVNGKFKVKGSAKIKFYYTVQFDIKWIVSELLSTPTVITDEVLLVTPMEMKHLNAKQVIEEAIIDKLKLEKTIKFTGKATYLPKLRGAKEPIEVIFE